ncbi:class I SAM-dependent methyltransferase (plasmid) [Haloferax sp. S1W]|uniref:class I SAM-dependent methyltransferase n=1 Tax=Haloferax sp. S1W TaxID=3377110 RepID=UPI0037C5C50E
MQSETGVSWEDWVSQDDYFDDLAVLGIGPFHPGGVTASRELLAGRDWTGQRVLDVGAGQGTTMRFLEAQGATVVGIEPSPYMRAAAQRAGVDPAQLRPNVIQEADLSGTFDAIVVEGVLGFIPDGVSELVAVSEQLAVGGVLLLSDWEPHDRESHPSYGLEIETRRSGASVANNLADHGFDCHVSSAETVASAFSLDVSEGVDRALQFFPDAPRPTIEAAVKRKIERMEGALSEDITCERYLLRATKGSSSI